MEFFLDLRLFRQPIHNQCGSEGDADRSGPNDERCMRCYPICPRDVLSPTRPACRTDDQLKNDAGNEEARKPSSPVQSRAKHHARYQQANKTANYELNKNDQVCLWRSHHEFAPKRTDLNMVSFAGVGLLLILPAVELRHLQTLAECDQA